MAFVIIEKGPSQDLGKTFTLGNDPVIIGRKGPGAQPDIALDDPYVSRRHAEIGFDQGRYVLRDLGSTNGTTIDDSMVQAGPPYRLVEGAVVGLALSSGAARVLLRFTDVTTLVGHSLPIAPRFASSWLSIAREKQEVRVDGELIGLSRKEYDLLSYLEANTGRLCRKDELVESVWPEVANLDAVSDAAIDQLVRRLRLKVEPDPGQPNRIVTRKGFGYMLVNR